MSWEKEIDRVLEMLFDRVEEVKKSRRGSIKQMHETMGVNPAYVYQLRRKWDEGQRTGFDLGMILQMLLALDIQPAEFFTAIYRQPGTSKRRHHQQTKQDLPSEVQGLLGSLEKKEDDG
jgi:hypothetical protein